MSLEMKILLTEIVYWPKLATQRPLQTFAGVATSYLLFGPPSLDLPLFTLALGYLTVGAVASLSHTTLA